jgi:hypothetical protein
MLSSTSKSSLAAQKEVKLIEGEVEVAPAPYGAKRVF